MSYQDSGCFRHALKCSASLVDTTLLYINHLSLGAIDPASQLSVTFSNCLLIRPVTLGEERRLRMFENGGLKKKRYMDLGKRK